MTPAAPTITRQSRLFEGLRRDGAERAGSRRGRRQCAEPGRVTLEQRLDGVLAAVASAGEAECPLCRAAMAPAEDGAACSGCGSTLL